MYQAQVNELEQQYTLRLRPGDYGDDTTGLRDVQTATPGRDRLPLMSVGRISGIIFSKDRPLQLDATLRSLKLNCTDLELADLHVLYVTSTAHYAAQYRTLVTQHPDVDFVREVDFKADLLGLQHGASSVFFVVDDTLFVGALSLGDATQTLERDRRLMGFSFRLGQNTTHCYMLKTEQAIPSFEALGRKALTFDWTSAEHDFGYPLEVASSVYRREDLEPLLRSLNYQNPNTLETELAAAASNFRAYKPRLGCYRRSVAFSVPANLVQTAWTNRAGDRPDLTAAALAQAYSKGLRIDVQLFREFVPESCHQEVEFGYITDPEIPAVSVVVPCYAQARYLQDAVESVVRQTFIDWELLIVDDGSPDDTAEVARRLAERHADRRVRILTLSNGGLARARNAGIANARGRYILPLDADDMIAPTFLEKAVLELESDPSTAIVYTDLQQVGHGTSLLRAADFDSDVVPDQNQLNYCSVYRREVWEDVGGYNPNMTHGYEDWDFWVGCVERGYGARRIPEALFLYRIREDGMYARAVARHGELRAQIQENHPTVYTMWARARRRVRLKAKWWPRRLWAVATTTAKTTMSRIRAREDRRA